MDGRTQDSKTEKVSLVSIVIPCLNSAHSIARGLQAILESDYPLENLEVLVIDGESSDATRKIVEEYQRKYPFINLLDNPQKTQQRALNIGIRAARGKYIIRMDAHSAFSKNSISQCVHYLETTEADNVGGRIITLPRVDTLLGRAIACVMSSVFGVGRSLFRVWSERDGAEPRWMPTVPYACYRREVFEKLGLFDERLDRSEDAEFHGRMQEAGCKTLFVPSIVNFYFSRSDLKSFLAHSFDNGFWSLLPWGRVGRCVVSLRHLVPMFFVMALIASSITGIFYPAAWLLFAGAVAGYALLNLFCSFQLAQKKREVRFMFVLPLLFACLHVGYGLGSLFGFYQALKEKYAHHLLRS